MTSHCADGIDESGRTVLVVVGPEAFFEVDFAEQHVDWMYPSEVQVEQMAEKGLAGSDLGPAESHGIRSLIEAEPIFSTVVVLESPNYIQ